MTSSASLPSAPAIDVLIVDDNEEYARVLGRLLQRDGLTVRTEPSALHAYRVLERYRVLVVATDQLMPGPLGSKLLESVAARWPRCRRLILSAFANSELFAEATQAHRVLDKSLPTPTILSVIMEEHSRAQEP